MPTCERSHNDVLIRYEQRAHGNHMQLDLKELNTLEFYAVSSNAEDQKQANIYGVMNIYSDGICLIRNLAIHQSIL